MMKDYHGNRIPYIYVLFAEADRERVLPVLENMDGHGFRFCGLDAGNPQYAGKALAVLAFFSESFLLTQQEAFFAAKDSGVPMIPVMLDNISLPETLQQAMYAQNSIIADRYPTPQALAERILTAEALAAPSVTPAQKKASRWMLGSICAGAAALLVLTVLLLIPRDTPAPVVEEVVRTEYQNPFGFTQEDLEAIREVNIIGEHYRFYTQDDNLIPGSTDLETLAVWEADGDSTRWIWKENMTETHMTDYDLSFLSIMPNVTAVRLANVRADALPDLSALTHLSRIQLNSCEIRGIQGASGTPITEFICHSSTVTDFSALTDCPRLHVVILSSRVSGLDFSGFGPKNLTQLKIDCAPEQANPFRFQGLKNCVQLTDVELGGFDTADLDSLNGVDTIENLNLYNMPRLRNVSALSSMSRLTTLTIDNAWNLYDLSPIGACTNLVKLHLYSLPATDVRFMNQLTGLREIDLHCQASDLEFLRHLNQKRGITLGFSGDIRDFSALSEIESFANLHVNLSGRSYHDLVEPYLENALVYEWLDLYECRDLRLDKIPLPVGGRMSIQYGQLQDLTNLPETVAELKLENIQTLASLNGLEDHKKLRNLTVNGCMRLTDWSALERTNLWTLQIGGAPILPDFGSFPVMHHLTLDSIPELTELSCLESMPNKKISLSLPGMDPEADLSALNCMEGAALSVPPELEVQAMKLVEDGKFRSYSIVFPEGEWRYDLRFSITSLEDLERLPQAVLSQVTELHILGDTVFDWEKYDIWTEWDDGNPVPVLHNRATEELLPVRPGTFTDLAPLSKLTGLRRLTLSYQPLENIDGIQQFSSLFDLNLSFCTALTDVSPAFSTDTLEWIGLQDTAVSSIQGIQNLPRLHGFNLSRSKVTDLSPLAQCDYAFSLQCGGLDLDLDNLEISDWTPLRSVPKIQSISINGIPADPQEVFSVLSGIDIASIGMDHVLHSQEDFEMFLQCLPHLQRIYLGNNPEVEDLTPLLAMPDLLEVEVGNEMQQQYDHLREQNPSFDLHIW